MRELQLNPLAKPQPRSRFFSLARETSFSQSLPYSVNHPPVRQMSLQKPEMFFESPFLDSATRSFQLQNVGSLEEYRRS